MKKKELKEKINQLYRDINELITNPDSYKSLEIKFRHQFRKDFATMVMLGKSK
jgi:hypothetical protein